jgi:putative FmdB family regulatory protein
MPIYEYLCPDCKKEFEVRISFSQASKPASCPICGVKGERLVSNFASTSGSGLGVPTRAALRGTTPAKVGNRATPARNLALKSAARRKTTT